MTDTNIPPAEITPAVLEAIAFDCIKSSGHRAVVTWTAEDIQNDFMEDWTLEQCQQWLDENQDSIENEMIECGREVISQLLHG